MTQPSVLRPMVRLTVRAIALFEYGLWHRLQTKVLVVAGGV
ncbi:hypothetical protein JCM19235_1900 [Vibrio maritimus]|uniref:Uncharacterized protein n=1 Tax=Vibrio maritimus TaxID=990268 RepID=A0A090SGA2_9VIBR|nr:hypothetical protein JCM19235_1900 [Vibrio maritimus]